jgi:hypothetical protein
MTKPRGGPWISVLLGLIGLGWLVGPAALIGSAIWSTIDYWFTTDGVPPAVERRASLLIVCAVALLLALPLLGLVIAGLTGRNVAMVTFGVLLALTLGAGVVAAAADVGSFLSDAGLWATSSRP